MGTETNVSERNKSRAKKKEDLRTERQAVRLTILEMNDLEEMAGMAGLRKPDYLRALIKNVRPIVVPESNKRAMDELRRLGGNINQIVVYLHQGAVMDGQKIQPLLEMVLGKIAEIRSDLKGRGGE
jgi:hypothetical protein